MFRLCPQIVPKTIHSVTNNFLTKIYTATLNKKFVAVTARYRQGREFKHVAPFNVYLYLFYLFI